MRKTLFIVLQSVLTLAVLAAAVLVFQHLRATAPEVQRATVEKQHQAVRFRVASRVDLPITIEAHGELRPAQEVILHAEVVGPVEWLSERLVPGQFVEKGEEILRIDPRDYRFALARAKATLDQANQNLELEEGRHRIARKEWDLFQGKEGAEGPSDSQSLALRLPQLQGAHAQVASAKSSHQAALLDLERTHVLAPFPALVQAKRVEVGQHVTAQTELVHLVGTTSAWVELPLAPRQLSHIRLPQASGEAGSTGVVSARIAGKTVERPARVLHLLPKMDEGVRFARVLVEVEDPFRIQDEKRGLPLLLGSYCTVQLEGSPLKGVVPLPRTALRERSRVFVLDDRDRLVTRPVQVVWERGDQVWVESGLEVGERFVVGHIPSPIEGSTCAPVADGSQS